MENIINFLNVNNGALMVIITAVYVVATIRICRANIKSAKASNAQVAAAKEQTDAVKAQLDESKREHEETKRLEHIDNHGVAEKNTSFHGTAIRIRVPTNNISAAQAIIDEIAAQGEVEARTIKNAFKTASMPSKGLMTQLNI